MTRDICVVQTERRFWCYEAALVGRIFISTSFGVAGMFSTRLVGLVLQPDVLARSQKVLGVRHSFFVQISSLTMFSETNRILWFRFVTPFKSLTKLKLLTINLVIFEK